MQSDLIRKTKDSRDRRLFLSSAYSCSVSYFHLEIASMKSLLDAIMKVEAKWSLLQGMSTDKVQGDCVVCRRRSLVVSVTECVELGS